MATPTDSRLGTSANGDLADRVQQLRLDTQLGAAKGAGSGSWLPWVLCGLLAVTWAGVGVRWYKAAPKDEAGAPASPGGAPQGPGGPVEAGAVGTQRKGPGNPAPPGAGSPRGVAAGSTEIFF